MKKYQYTEVEHCDTSGRVKEKEPAGGFRSLDGTKAYLFFYELILYLCIFQALLLCILNLGSHKCCCL